MSVTKVSDVVKRIAEDEPARDNENEVFMGVWLAGVDQTGLKVRP